MSNEQLSREIEHTSPLDTSLTLRAKSPEEQLAYFVEDLSDARSPGVYALRLSKPDADLEELWAEEYDAMHPDIEELQSADRIYYIGGAKDVLARLHEHLDTPNRSGAVMAVCPIHSVAEVWWYPTKEKAFQEESRIAIEFRNRTGAYVAQA